MLFPPTIPAFPALKKLLDPPASSLDISPAASQPQFNPHPAAAVAAFSLLNAATQPAAAVSNTCAKCGITFRMTSDLVYHMRTHHTRPDKERIGGGTGNNNDARGSKKQTEKLKCNVCGENFKERHHLTRHMTAHQDLAAAAANNSLYGGF